MPPDLTLEEQALNQLVVEGITTDYRIVDDANTQKIVKSFFQQLEPVAFPVTKDEYEKAAFINGYIQIEFETGDGVYAIHGDNPSTILVSFSNGGDNEPCYGIYSVTTEAFESVVSYLYEYSETADVNDDANETYTIYFMDPVSGIPYRSLTYSHTQRESLLLESTVAHARKRIIQPPCTNHFRRRFAGRALPQQGSSHFRQSSSLSTAINASLGTATVPN